MHPECSTWASDGCQRCGRPLCEVHLPSSRARCEDCEQVLQRRKDKLVHAQRALEQHIDKPRIRDLLYVAMFAVVPIVVFEAEAGLSNAIFAAIAPAFFGVLLWRRHRLSGRPLRQLRREFLAERKVSELAAQNHPELPAPIQPQLPPAGDQSEG